MNILVIGGTGFLGYHACLELTQRGHRVTALGIPPGPAPSLLPESVRIVLMDIATADDRAVDALMETVDAVVFAAGADDRQTPPAPAQRFFFEANVRTTVRVAAAALRARLKKMIILGSYFTYFDRQWPEMKLAEVHPYIHSRKEQMKLATDIAGDAMAVVVLELPYIFGAMPGAAPLWTPLVNYVRSGTPLVYPRGGSNMIAVEGVAQAIAGACEDIQQSSVFQIGDENLTWTQLLQLMCRAIGRKDDKVHIIDNTVLKSMSWMLDAIHSIKGLEGGLHSREFANLLVENAFFDPSASQTALGYNRGTLEQAIQATVAASPEHLMFDNWPRFLQHLPGLTAKR